jgi:hypothetical protein
MTKPRNGLEKPVLVIPSKRGMYSKKYKGLMKEDEFNELCHELGEDPNEDG